MRQHKDCEIHALRMTVSHTEAEKAGSSSGCANTGCVDLIALCTLSSLTLRDGLILTVG